MHLKFSIFGSFAVLLLCIGNGSLADAWVARGNYYNAAHPGKCVISDTIIISPGESVKSPTSCSQIHCANEKGDARIVGCGAILPPDGCKWGEHVNRNAPFKECCARHLICEGGLTKEMELYQQDTWEMFSPNFKNSL
uniref:Single domain-containing protein n=1 Tax=Ceratitis capitata TaxID=7213 RepID=W8BVI1_CERCA